MKKTPQKEYWTPILKILNQDKEGSVKTRKIKEELLKVMDNQFTQDDLQSIPIRENHFEQVWWNQARHAAEKMRKEKLLAPSTKHTIWTITEKGRQYLKPINLFPDEIEENPSILEGAKYQITVNAYERNPKARQKCIEHYGTICCICGFSFKTMYGELVENFIHVHHLKPLSEIGSEYTVDPVNDLRPVCPNCHAVLHIKTPALSIEEVKKLLQKN